MSQPEVKESERLISPSVECFFCSGHLPCRDHKSHQFADLDLQEYIMGEISGEEFLERQGVGAAY